jgi:hypothetical protein
MSSLRDRTSACQTSPSSDGAGSFTVGQNLKGAWIALETHGLAGGIFVSRDAALHYAQFETSHRPGAVRFASRPLDLKV